MDGDAALNAKVQSLERQGVASKPLGTGLPTYPAGHNTRMALFNRQRHGQAGS
ncbi:hypothetical protein CTB91_02115 [Dickeya solani]|uniref:Uncharacterized protein n=1 Tax=Dickeya solani D s0432-1 TaxID=1231725 RepID=A0AAV3KEG2_9GAMM|nr:hypothetical protein CTB91_02115 [Dickeya solani]ERO58900.1 hypothetical protein A544_2081 [Dickeya solani D s0432-1]AYQ52088.1 hypothetical protein DSOL99_02120 [Dickeya solani]MBD3605451.1 hypothetical protein [Dickeya solani]NUA40089.1 hypothetical protein [Dickeya solani]